MMATGAVFGEQAQVVGGGVGRGLMITGTMGLLLGGSGATSVTVVLGVVSAAL